MGSSDCSGVCSLPHTGPLWQAVNRLTAKVTIQRKTRAIGRTCFGEFPIECGLSKSTGKHSVTANDDTARRLSRRTLLALSLPAASVLPGYGARPSGRGPLSQSSGAPRRSLGAGRPHRPDRANHLARSRDAARPAPPHHQPPRRWREHRHAADRKVAGRRLHADGRVDRVRRQHEPVSRSRATIRCGISCRSRSSAPRRT